MSWPEVKLGEIANVDWGNTSITKSSYVDSGFPAFSATGQDGFLSVAEINEDGIVLSAIGARCGKCFLAKGQWTAIKNTITIIPNKSKVDLNYLYTLLNDEKSWQSKGAAQPFITLGIARNRKIPLPPLAEQKRIAAILDKASEIEVKRKRAIAKLDELAQSTFVEMFGDFTLNESNWNAKTLKEISVTKGQYGGGFSAAELRPNSPRYVRITDITDGGELKPNAVSADGEENDFANYYLAEGDLLFARSGATVGKAYLHKSKLPHIYAGYLIRFVIDIKQALPEYVYAVTRTQYYKNWVLSKQNVVAQPNINAQQYGDLKIPVPPLSLQTEYAQFTDALLRQKQKYNTTAGTLSRLVHSLQHQAFTTGLTP